MATLNGQQAVQLMQQMFKAVVQKAILIVMLVEPMELLEALL